MASEKGPVATEAPPLSSTDVSDPATALAPVSVESLQADATRATASLKRAREATPTSPSSAITAQLSADLSPSKAARLIGFTSRRSPAPLTAAAALEDERRRQEEQYKLQVSGASENPAYKVQSDLMSAGALSMSRPLDAPSFSHDLPTVSIPATTSDPPTKADTSPQSATSMASLSGGAPVTASPGPMEIDPQLERASYAPQPQAQMEESASNTSLSYPGLINAAAAAMPAPPARGMSMPMTPGQQGAPKSPNSKKHKCPDCDAEFTRQHNLKSHLLTHSHDKPYACQTCQMRFRRLHDLKRHSKLHTGEKPHVCPKCDRKFARGDALARHSKGPGGCVSRRGSLFGDDDFQDSSQLDGGDDSTMSGVVYDGGNESEMTEEERRRLSLPSIKAQHVQGGQGVTDGYAPHARTYPPGTATGGRLYPPNVERGSTSSNASHAPNTSISSLPSSGGNASLYSQTGMTESPKPLSPGIQGHDGNINRQRSPSLTTQFQQQHFGRHQTDRHTPPVPGFAANETRYTPGQSTTQGATPNSQGAPGAAAVAPMESGTSNGPGQNGGSGDSSSNNIFATDQGLWAYIHNLEEIVQDLGGRVNVLEQTEKANTEKITNLNSEILSLRSQLEAKSDAPVTTEVLS